LCHIKSGKDKSLKLWWKIELLPKRFTYHPPAIPSAGIYYFKSDAGIQYEVRFGRKQSDILSVNLVFGVRNEEYDGEEYVLTNKGEFYSVMLTIEAIINDFLDANPNIHAIEFAGEPAGGERKDIQQTKRTKVYLRHAKRIFSADYWAITTEGNKVSIERAKNH
jgi:hypothetical protein